MNFGNITTQQIVDTLPTVLVGDGYTITGAGIEHWAAFGWRKITEVEQPASGYRATGYNVVEIDGLTCRLTISASVDIVAETARVLDADRAERWSGKRPVDILTQNKYGGLL